MKAYCKGYNNVVAVDTSITITEVTETRVKGTAQWPNGKGVSEFNVKRQPGNKFFKGSGSGKITYHFE